MLETYYVIRHKASGLLMPQAKGDRGYSHWNPSNNNLKFISAMDIPRLFSIEKKARRAIIEWGKGLRNIGQVSEWGDIRMEVASDGRKREDLEVKTVYLMTQNFTLEE